MPSQLCIDITANVAAGGFKLAYDGFYVFLVDKRRKLFDKVAIFGTI
jgi:hypothetical protein